MSGLRRALIVAGIGSALLVVLAGAASAETTVTDNHEVNCSPSVLICADQVVGVGPLVSGPLVDTGTIGPFEVTVNFPNGFFGPPPAGS